MAGVESPSQEEAILGRTHGDADRLFPRKTNAFAAATSEVQVNGKALKIWEYAQLETLNNAVLKQRAMAIRDAVGEANCPPIPSAHAEEMIRWILHMQAELANQTMEIGHPKQPGRGCAVPSHFLQNAKERPISWTRPESPRGEKVPFGPRQIHADHVGKRDSYRHLKAEDQEFADAEHHMNLGIQSMRAGGEGRKHIHAHTNMVNMGTSSAEPQGIQSLKSGGEGRRYLGCVDSVAGQKRDMEAINRGYLAPAPPTRLNADPQKHVSHTQMRELGTSDPAVEPHIGGERRRRGQPQDHMDSIGTSKHMEDPKTMGRRHLDSFGGSRHKYGDSHETYQSNWKKDPSRLHGTSLII